MHSFFFHADKEDSDQTARMSDGMLSQVEVQLFKLCYDTGILIMYAVNAWPDQPAYLHICVYKGTLGLY